MSYHFKGLAPHFGTSIVNALELPQFIYFDILKLSQRGHVVFLVFIIIATLNRDYG